MSYCATEIIALASGIYQGLGSQASESPAFISGWITSPSVIGGINTRLNTSFYYSGGCIEGGFSDAEGAITELFYQKEYYRRQSQQVLTAGGLNWVTLKEGDSSISRANPVDMSKAFLGLSKDAEEDLRIAVANWKRGNSTVNTVNAADLASWPSP